MLLSVLEIFRHFYSCLPASRIFILANQVLRAKHKVGERPSGTKHMPVSSHIATVGSECFFFTFEMNSNANGSEDNRNISIFSIMNFVPTDAAVRNIVVLLYLPISFHLRI